MSPVVLKKKNAGNGVLLLSHELYPELLVQEGFRPENIETLDVRTLRRLTSFRALNFSERASCFVQLS